MRELLEGVSLATFAAGNRRIIKAVKARTTTPEPEPCTHPDHKKNPTHAEHCPSHPAPQQPTAPAEDVEHPFVTWSKRAGGTVAALVLLWPIVGKWVPTVVGGSLALWVIAALIAGQPDPSADPATGGDDQADDDAPEDDDNQAEEEPEEEPDQTPAATLPTPADARLAVAVLGAAGTHVALTAVTAHLAAAHPLWKRSGKATSTLLEEAGVRVRAGVKVEGISVRGIHHDDVPPLPSPSEGTPGRVVVAGQSNNNNANNAEEWSGREGFVMRADPENPARTIIVSHVHTA
ncbi:hypothetical protein PUR71_00885 [Streptomyces sp. SP17BM10]|uniref:hypothetical protein n=1 Tax=Streptomyces sp. SP17BM10 TaxID=3002530 RepID=UPI002E7777A2|nr:hypothetical protein [Streptomyces sp. SP17BM10]MEE1781501.1 hypothetical protein [Streptomyces sp. SP17BM10]